MRNSRGLLLLACCLVLAGVVWLNYFRDNESGPGVNGESALPGSAAVGVEGWQFKSEQHWLVDEIGRDIVEMVFYAKDAAVPVAGALDFKTELVPGKQIRIVYTTKDAAGATNESFTMVHHLWAVENYSPWAQRLLGTWKINPSDQFSPPDEGLIKSLGAAEPMALVECSQRISVALSQHPLDAELHEEAALVLGAFTLREAAGQFSDTRRALCRMTAHLALAQALRAKTGPCGQLAELIQLSLVNREAEAMEKIAHLPADESAWANALKMRCTGDWRILSKPESAGLMEQMEYGRALVRSVTAGLLVEFLQKAKLPPAPIWNRIATERNFSVQEGHLFAKEGFSAELGSLAEDWKGWSGRELKEDNVIQILNDPATRAVVKSDKGRQQIEVISWGDLASFHQRHICHSVQRTVEFLRYLWGVPDEAAAFEQAVNSRFSGMRLFPIALKRCAQVPSQYGAGMKGALELCNKTPELVTPSNWVCISEKSNFGTQNTKTPNPLAWFTPELPFGTAIDFNARYYDLHHLWQADLATWEELKALAPWDIDVIRAHRHKRHGGTLSMQQVVDSFSKIGDYHLEAMRETGDYCKSDPKACQKYMGRACELNPDLYIDLGTYLVDNKLKEDAAAAYQTAFEKARDRVKMANASGWIVNYYFDHARKDDALKIATEAAEVYSYVGLETMANLMERMEKPGDAEKYYSSIAERYNDAGPLSRFYLHNKDKDQRYADALNKITEDVFPEGVKMVKLADFTGPPVDGVVVKTTNANTKRAGLKLGDVFVAFDGYQVHSVEQYMWVRALSTDPKMVFMVWSGGKFSEISVSLPERRFGNQVSTYQGH